MAIGVEEIDPLSICTMFLFDHQLSLARLCSALDTLFALPYAIREVLDP